MTDKEIRKIMGELEDRGYLEYGAIIPSYVFEELFQEKCEKDWDFLGPLLEIKEELVTSGYLCTQRDMPFGCLKIYDTHEIATQADRLFNNLTRKIARLNKCLIEAKFDQFNERELRMHLHQSNKLCSSVHALNSCLNKI